MLALQRELSQAIAEQIRLTLSPERLRALGRRQTRSAEAYDLYLQGRHFWQQLSPPATKKAIEYFARATDLDPDYALAWSGLADCLERYVPPYAMAMVYAGLAQLELAQQWLECCYDARDVHLIFLTLDPKWDPLRSEPRFSSHLRRCGFAQQWLFPDGKI